MTLKLFNADYKSFPSITKVCPYGHTSRPHPKPINLLRYGAAGSDGAFWDQPY